MNAPHRQITVHLVLKLQATEYGSNITVRKNQTCCEDQLHVYIWNMSTGSFQIEIWIGLCAFYFVIMIQKCNRNI